MKEKEIKNMGRSVNARLKNIAENQKVDFSYLLLRYAYERFLYRLGASRFKDNFILKGASVFTVWFGPMFRVTRDTDFLCHGASSPEHLVRCFRDICEVEVPDDGVVFDLSSITAQEIKKSGKYRGTRIIFSALIYSARVSMRFDIGFGDTVYPEPEIREFPRILETFQPPSIFVYSPYSVVAEKFEAIVSLGNLNSRVKDYFDIWLLSERLDFKFPLLKQAITSTFHRRENTIPSEIPIGLSPLFYGDRDKQLLWNHFVKRVGPALMPENLQTAAERIKEFVLPVIQPRNVEPGQWKAGIGWE